MIIAIDGNEANIKNRVGVNTYAFELLWGLWKLQSEWGNRHKLIVFLKSEPMGDLPKETECFKYKVIEGGNAWILKKLTPYLFKHSKEYDLFFSPSHYAPFFIPMPKYCSIMDLGYLEFTGQFTKKDFWQLKLWTAISIFVSKGVFAISNSTKKDIVRHYPYAKDKIQVTYLAYNNKKFNLDISSKDVRRIGSRHSIVSDYVLYLGTLKPSKNIEGLLEAFSLVTHSQSIDTNLKLVIAGKKGWMFDGVFKKVKDLGLEDKVIFTDFIPEEEKPALIKGAKAFILPSFWEGFGLDILNAMACGVPVVASNVGSIPEVVGEAGILVDPKSTESMAEGIKKVISLGKTDYNSMIERGLVQASKFSWEKTARKTLEVLTKEKYEG